MNFSTFHRLALATVLGFMFSSVARADFKGQDYDSFVATTHHAEILELRDLYDLSQGLKTAEVEALLPHFQKIVKNQVGIWSDTILEGDYDADGPISLDSVQAVYQDGKLVAYKVRYSQHAWQLDDQARPGVEGRIEEESFVSPSMKSWLRNEASLATFKPF